MFDCGWVQGWRGLIFGFECVHESTSVQVCVSTSIQTTDIGNLHGLDAHMAYSFFHSNRHVCLHGLDVYIVSEVFRKFLRYVCMTFFF